MSKSLEEWQEHLHQHFSALAAQRTVSGLPIFALEHGLSEEQIEEISNMLRSRVNTRERLAPHWLLWAVYAAEQGYTYDGSQYWQSFEENTPGWRENCNRDSLSVWFRKFKEKYNGVVPSGPWANHFRIIAQPITHAILPRYLQHQFARTLYYLRFELARVASESPRAVGQAISVNTHYSTARFEEFLQQEELVGRIALALVSKDAQIGKEPILPATLERIVADLEHVRQAREWMKETRHVVTSRFRGIGHGTGPRETEINSLSTDKYRTDPRYNIRPNLSLRHKGDNCWQLVVHVPNFREVAALDKELQEFLMRTRCLLNGDTVKRAAGWILSGNRRAILKKWPESKKPLVKFEQDNGLINHFLESEFWMRCGPIWLFRVQRDGSAHEITGSLIVRPGQDYILIAQAPFKDNSENMESCMIDCNDAEAVRISVPSNNISKKYEHWLQKIGLELRKTIRVWPAGLAGQNWDGEGHSDWFDNERLCIGIAHDHPVDAYILTIDDSDETCIEAPIAGQPTFVKLPYLESGKHLLRVKAQRGSSIDDTLEGYLQLNVREPESWTPNTSSHAGLVVTVDPYNASLDILWENEFNLEVLGPHGRQITPFVSLENATGDSIFEGQVCPSLELPVRPEIWRQKFSKFLKKNDCSDLYLEASTGLLRIEADELGQYLLRFNHSALPVRWALRRPEDKILVRLFDDTEQDANQTKCFFFGIETPVKLERLDFKHALEGMEISRPGGLYVAENNSGTRIESTVVVSEGLTMQGFEGLGVNPDYPNLDNSPSTIRKVAEILRLWHEARSTGALATVRRKTIVHGLLEIFYGKFLGNDWAQQEAAFVRVTGNHAVADRIKKFPQSSFKQNSSFLTAIEDDVENTLGKSAENISNWFAVLAERHNLCSDTSLCAFAVNVAGRPHKLGSLYPKGLEDLIINAKNNLPLLRCARYMVLLHVSQSGRSGDLLPRW